MSRRTHIPCWEYSSLCQAGIAGLTLPLISAAVTWEDKPLYRSCRPWHPRLKREVCAADFTAWQGHQFPFLFGHFSPLFGHFMFTAALTRGRAVRQFHPDGGVACLPAGTGLLLTSCYPNDEDERKRDQGGICKRV